MIVGSKFKEKSVHEIGIRDILARQSHHFSSNRIDLVIKYLAIEEYFGKNSIGFDLYDKDLEVNLKRRAVRYRKLKYSRSRIRSKISSHRKQHGIKKFKRLVNKIEKQYRSDSPINISEYHQLRNGSHRLACALYFGHKSIPCRINSTYDRNPDYSMRWYENNGFFSKEDLLAISDKSKQIIPPVDEGVAVLVELNDIFREQRQDFGKDKFYQSYEPLNIYGQRSSILRFEKYGFKKLLKKGHEVLDVGCNCGFFTHCVAPHVKKVDGFDYNEPLIRMANVLKQYLNNNTNFRVSEFSSFAPDTNYDIVIVSAMHQWVDMSVKSFCQKIFQWLKKDSFVLLESHHAHKDKKYGEIMRYFNSHNLVRLREGTTDDTFPIVHRKFSLWRKTDN